MILYTCRVPNCFGSKVVSTEKRMIFRHYLTHLKSDLENTAYDLGILTYNENRYSIINALIEVSGVKVNKND